MSFKGKILPCPYMVKPFKNLLLQKWWTDFNETLHEASMTQVLQYGPDIDYSEGKKHISFFYMELFSKIFRHFYWYIQQISCERLQDHCFSGFSNLSFMLRKHNNKLPVLYLSGGKVEHISKHSVVHMRKIGKIY